MMRLGITIPLDGFQNPHFPELVRHAERVGFTDAWSFETFVSDGIAPVAAAAVVSERMRLGTAIIPVFTRPAALIAMSAASIQRLSGGRFILGVGISTPTIVEQWMGVPYKMPVTRLRETIEALRASFSGQKVTMAGKTVQINGFRLPKLDPPPPIYVGAQGALMLRTAGEIGDGVIVNYITPESFAPMLAHIHEGVRAAGKPIANLDIACRIQVAIDPEDEIVRENLRRELTAYVTVPQYNKFFREIGYENEARVALEAWNAGDRKKALQSMPDHMIEALYVLGTPAQIAKRLHAFEAAGITTSTLQFISYAPDPEEKRRRVLRAIETLAADW
ncbi:MAG: LLM class F420-dependent oxidoreductase [Candidatus Binataceae bacterium]|nr:LLM class F420-dependent oxidoreductase [Candidatus Binataceae bacterium]